MDNRQLATAILASVAVLSLVIYQKTRQPLMSAIRILVEPKVFIPVLTYTGWLAFVVWLADRAGLWRSYLLADTVFWFVLVGIGWYLGLNRAGKDADFFRRRVLEAMGLAAFLEFFINLKSLPLLGEVVLQLGLILLVALHAVSRTSPEYRPARRLLDWLLAAIGVWLILYTVNAIASDWDSLELGVIWRQLALPVWLTISALPIIFLAALIAGYELLFLHLRWLNERHLPSWRALGGVIRGLRVNLRDIQQFRGPHAREAARAPSFSAAHEAVKRFKRDREADQARRAVARARLVDYAGVEGVDELGRQLDRREFEATKSALRWLATCHMGWYRQHGRYRADLLDVIGDFERQGLPAAHGITMRVSGNGQSWYAYRPTPSGWNLGIGASGPPPSQWLYAAERSPETFPGGRGGWKDDLRESSVEWRAELPVVR